MKNAIVLALVLFGSLAQAETVCAISGQNQLDKNTYDREVFAPQKISGQRTVIVKNQKVLDVEIGKFTSMDQWRSIHGAYLVSFSVEESGSQFVTISIAKIDANKPENLAKLLSSSAGNGEVLMSTAEQAKLAAACTTLKSK